MGRYIKRFWEWIKVKSELDRKDHQPPLFKEREIWWCYLGENVGTEVNGKSRYFTRPVLVLRKYDRYSFLALPLTTKQKAGTWHATFMHKGKVQTAQLTQSRTLSYKRLKELMGKIDEVDYDMVKKAFIRLHS